MSTLLATLAVAFVIIMIAIVLLAISWLITGKTNMRPGACGRDPTKNRDENASCNKDVSCGLCKKPDGKKDENL